MSRIPEYPPLLQGSINNQMLQMRDYLMRLVKAMEDDGLYDDNGGGGEGTTDYNDLENKPSINNVALTGNKQPSQIGLAAASHTHTTSNITDFPELANVATSGAYSDLTGRPSLAAVATSGAYSDLTGTPALADVATSGDYGDLENTPSLSTVATSGSYADLSNRPSINLVPLSGNKQPAELGLATTSHNHTVSQITDMPAVGDILSVLTKGLIMNVPAGSVVTNGISAARTGYTPIGIVGTNITVADRDKVELRTCYYYNSLVYFSLYNNTDADISTTVYAYILYKEDS